MRSYDTTFPFSPGIFCNILSTSLSSFFVLTVLDRSWKSNISGKDPNFTRCTQKFQQIKTIFVFEFEYVFTELLL